jgi:hypothetical protein
MQSASKRHGQISETCSPQNKTIHINKCLQTVFEVQPNNVSNLNPSYFCPWEHKKSLVCQVQTENGKTLHQRTLPVKPFATALGAFLGCDSPWSEVPTRVGHFKHLLWTGTLINDKNSTVIKQGTCIVNVLSVVNKKYYIVRVFTANYNLSVKPTYFRTHVYMNFLLMSRTHSRCLSKHFRYNGTQYTYKVFKELVMFN